jgi:hypothetical protein
MLGMQFVVQDFADTGLRVCPRMFAHGAMMAHGCSDFFEGTDVVFVHFFPLLFFWTQINPDLHG